MRTALLSRLTVAIIPLVAPFVTSACSREARGASTPAEPAVPVRVANVGTPGTIVITATGTFGAKDEVPLSFKIGGIVARVTVDEGERVRAGQVLAELDLREIDAAVAKAAAAAEKYHRDAARLERLYHDSVATIAQWQDVQTARDAADADLRAARVNREYAVITAPSSGVVLRRSSNSGSLVTSGATILVVAFDRRGSVVRVGLADRDAMRVRQGDCATVTFDALPERSFPGNVRQIAAAADPRSGTFTVEIALSGAGALPSGLVGRVRIDATGGAGRAVADTGVSAIPAEALVEGQEERGMVFTLDTTARIARRHEVTLVGVDGDRVLVRGLAGVSRVITAGAAWLRDSSRVEVKP